MGKRFALASVGASCLGLALLLLWGTTQVGSTQSDLLEIVREGTRSSAEASRTGRGVVTVHRWGQDSGGAICESHSVCQVVFSGDRFKVAVAQTYLRNDPTPGHEPNLMVPPGTVLRTEMAFDGDKLIVYYPDERAANISAMSLSGMAAVYLGDISPKGLGFREMGSGPGPWSVSRESLGGKPYIVLHEGPTAPEPSLRNVSYKTIYWLDENEGFTQRRVAAYATDDDHTQPVLGDEVDSEVRDYGDGLWGPGKSTRVSYRPDKGGAFRKSSEVTTTYDPTFVLNAPVSDADLSLTLPSGTKVYDATLHANYVVP